MSAPPTPNPEFNASDFVTASTSGFSQSQADARYLQLATSCNATAGQTFDGGVFTGQLNTNTIDCTTAGVLTIGGTNCSGVVFSDTIIAPNEHTHGFGHI